MTMRLLTALLAVTSALSACSGDDAAAQRECPLQIRLNSTIYTGAGYTEVRGTRIATIAELAECHDIGPTPEGSVFSESSEQVAVWSLPGYSTNEVVAARFGGEDSFAIFVADSMPQSKIDRFVRQLSSSRK